MKFNLKNELHVLITRNGRLSIKLGDHCQSTDFEQVAFKFSRQHVLHMLGRGVAFEGTVSHTVTICGTLTVIELSDSSLHCREIT